MKVSFHGSPRSVGIVETNSTPDLCRAYALSRLPHLFMDQTLVLPSSSPSVTDRLRQTCEFLGTPCEVSQAQSFFAKLGQRSGLPEIETSFDDLATCLKQVYEFFLPGQFVYVKHASPKSCVVVDDRSVLFCFSQDGLLTACQYGLLTGRSIIYCEGPQDYERAFAFMRNAKSIYVSPPVDLSVEILRELLVARRTATNKAPIGFFYPFGELDREFFALKSFLYSRLKRRGVLPYTFFYPLEAMSDAFEFNTADFIIGKGGTPQTNEAKLTRPAEFLFSTPHSNGVDMSLGHIVLCSKQDYQPKAQPPRQAMPCFYADVCSRKTEHNMLLGASQVRSIIVFLYTCWGVLLENSIYDVEISLGRQFAASPYTAALLTTYSMSLLDRAAGFYVAEKYSLNVSIGEVANNFNRLHFERYKDHENVILLFGDPDFRLGQLQGLPLSQRAAEEPSLARFVAKSRIQFYEAPLEPIGTTSPAGVEKIPDRVFAALDYTRCVVNGTKVLQREKLAPSLGCLSTQTETLWTFFLLYNSRLLQSDKLAFEEQLMTSKRAELTKKFQRAWLEFYRAMVGHLGGYLRLQVDRYFAGHQDDTNELPMTCPYCGTALLRYTQSLTGGTQVTRRVIECFNCATIFDGLSEFTRGEILCERRWHAGSEVEIAIDLQIEGLERGNYLAAAFLEPFIKTGRDDLICSTVEGSAEFSQNSFRIRLPSVRILDIIIPGCYHLNVLILVETSILTLRRAVYLDR